MAQITLKSFTWLVFTTISLALLVFYFVCYDSCGSIGPKTVLTIFISYTVFMIPFVVANVFGCFFNNIYLTLPLFLVCLSTWLGFIAFTGHGITCYFSNHTDHCQYYDSEVAYEYTIPLFLISLSFMLTSLFLVKKADRGEV